MSTRSNKGIGLLLVEPLNLERVIHKSKRAVDTLQVAIGSVEIQESIDTVHLTSIDTVHLTSIDTVHLTSIDTVHLTSIDTVHLTSIDTVHLTSIDTVHLTSIDTVHLTSIDTVHLTSIDTVHLTSIDTVHLTSIDTVHLTSIDTVHLTSIDTVHLTSIDTVHLTSIDTVHLTSIDTVHLTSIDTVHLTSIDTVHLTSIDTVHLTSIDTAQLTSIDTVHPTSIDTAHQPSIDTVHPPSTDTVHPPSDTTFLEAEKGEALILTVAVDGLLSDEEGLPHQDPRDLINELEELASASEQNEVSVDHINCKIFPYSLFGDAFSWFSQLQPRSLTCWEDIKTAFLNKFLYEATTTREKEKNDKWDRFLALLDEEYMIPIQLLDDIMAKRDEQHVSGELSRVEEAGKEDSTSTSTDGRTSMSTDGMTSTSTDGWTSTSPDEEAGTEGRTSKSTDITTSTSIDITTSTSIDDVDREITTEDSLELEEWLEDIYQNSKKKLDDDQHTSRGDLETSKDSIGRPQPDEIDRQPPHIIDLHPPDIDRHHPPNIDRCPLLDVPPGLTPCCPKHQRPPIWTEEAAGFHKRVMRIHDPVKIVVSCAVFETESPIPLDRSMQFSSYIEVLDDRQHVEASQRGLRFQDEVDKGPAEHVSIDTDRIPSIDTNKPASIDTTTSPSIDTTASPSIDTTTSSSIDTRRVSE
uniref:Retrotransposon gag domain-containing protein n=1 Tax=Brassica oleracea var. oleracea TaxID=109376 RepID=A0A0D3DK39_BRAOL